MALASFGRPGRVGARFNDVGIFAYDKQPALARESGELTSLCVD